jgi:hypothetical protein
MKNNFHMKPWQNGDNITQVSISKIKQFRYHFNKLCERPTFQLWFIYKCIKLFPFNQALASWHWSKLYGFIVYINLHMFCRSLFVLLYFFFCPLYCLFFGLLILITSLVSSNSSCPLMGRSNNTPPTKKRGWTQVLLKERTGIV